MWIGTAKFRLGDWAVPDLVAAFALPNEAAAALARKLPQGAIELRGHSGCGASGFTQRRDLQEDRGGIDPRVIVRQEVERHGGDLRQELVEGPSVGGGGNVVAMPAPAMPRRPRRQKS